MDTCPYPSILWSNDLVFSQPFIDGTFWNIPQNQCALLNHPNHLFRLPKAEVTYWFLASADAKKTSKTASRSTFDDPAWDLGTSTIRGEMSHLLSWWMFYCHVSFHDQHDHHHDHDHQHHHIFLLHPYPLWQVPFNTLPHAGQAAATTLSLCCFGVPNLQHDSCFSREKTCLDLDVKIGILSIRRKFKMTTGGTPYDTC